MGKTTGFLDYKRRNGESVPADKRIKNFDEFHGTLSLEEQKEQGARCMACGVPFCQYGEAIAGMTSGCPLHNLVPEFNDLVYRGRWEQAYERLAKTHGLAEFTLSRRDPEYVGRSKKVDVIEKARRSGADILKDNAELADVFDKIKTIEGFSNIVANDTEIGSMIYAKKPGDGSAREQAASCQRVIGGLANIAKEYATKRYRSNVMNWGMLPFLLDAEPDFEVGDYIFVPNIKSHLRGDMSKIPAYIIGNDIKEISLNIAEMTDAEKSIVEAGSLINYNKSKIK